MAVFVARTPTATAAPPPLVSFVAVHAGGFSGGTEKPSVHVGAMGLPATPGAPSVTLPAESAPTIAAPVPQSGPSAGEAANEEADQHSTAVPANRATITPLVLDKYRPIFTAPALSP